MSSAVFLTIPKGDRTQPPPIIDADNSQKHRPSTQPSTTAAKTTLVHSLPIAQNRDTKLQTPLPIRFIGIFAPILCRKKGLPNCKFSFRTQITVWYPSLNIEPDWPHERRGRTVKIKPPLVEAVGDVVRIAKCAGLALHWLQQIFSHRTKVNENFAAVRLAIDTIKSLFQLPTN